MGDSISTYYKATRPDGTDFYSGKVSYEPGWTYTVTGRDDWCTELCSSAVIHASKSPTETLIGGYWPCRLFEVEGVRVVWDCHKSGFREFTVVREVPAWWALGPNGQEVEWVIGRIAKATRQQIHDLAAARETARAAAWAAAWTAAWTATWTATQEAAAWTATRAAARETAWTAWTATREATRVTIARDLISADQYDLLYGPFRSVFGDPPVFGDDGGYPRFEE